MTSTKGTSATTALKQVRTHVGDGAHEQPAGAASTNGQPVLRRIPLPLEKLRGGDEVGEGVLLLHHLAVVVPLAAHLLAAANVRDGVDDPAVEQRELFVEKFGSVLKPYEPYA